ncbi:MAG: hypothetical protein C0593_09335 [Marinilabiliales bacterium]|nr:MAG: hypothetical protein C0593_09335 [Marinilabiliales bacterium]
MNRIFFSIVLCFFAATVAGQEVIVPLAGNPELQGRDNKKAFSQKDEDNLLLPFFDDFYQDRVYPDESKWDGYDGFQNQDFAVFPITQGVLTLDALDELGRIHSNALPGPSNWISDIVTSKAIRLDSVFSPNPIALHTSDSLYFSFFYQPGGGLGPHPFNDIGTPPESQDSLVLEFLAPGFSDTTWIEIDTVINGVSQTITVVDKIEEAWDYVWSSEGMVLDSLILETDEGYYFKQVMIPITDEERYFHKDFRFRFSNYVSLSSDVHASWQSNADMWNIDYVYLDKDRTINEQSVKDLAFANKAGTMLSKYHSMPFNQYKENYVFEMVDSVENKITNLDTESYNMIYKYRITNEQGGLVYEYNGGSFIINPYAENGYSSHIPFAKPPAQFIFPISNADSAEFLVSHFLSSDENLPFKGNDTISFTQKFHNYYAYDNGTPENGYGVDGDENGMVAIQFSLNKADTLRGINLYFNEILDPSSDQSFYLTVWNHGDRKPGSIIYEQYELRPEPVDYRNNYHTFILDEPVIINQTNFPNLIFYVGWQKDNDDEILNIGYDRSRDSRARTFYHVNGIWYNSLQSGSVMIRPLLGKTLPYNTGIEQIDQKAQISVFPNPVSGEKLYITSGDDFHQGEITIYNSTGTIILQQNYTPEIVVGHLPSGLYIIRFTDNKGLISTSKFVISK